MSEQKPKEDKVQSLVVEVAETITKSGDDVRKRLVKAMVEKELATRVDDLDKAFQKRDQLSKELKKLDKKDIEVLDGSGEVIQSGYTRGLSGLIKKAKEK